MENETVIFPKTRAFQYVIFCYLNFCSIYKLLVVLYSVHDLKIQPLEILVEWPDSSVGRAPTYKVRGREFESRSGRLFSRTFTFH